MSTEVRITVAGAAGRMGRTITAAARDFEGVQLENDYQFFGSWSKSW